MNVKVPVAFVATFVGVVVKFGVFVLVKVLVGVNVAVGVNVLNLFGKLR